MGVNCTCTYISFILVFKVRAITQDLFQTSENLRGDEVVYSIISKLMYIEDITWPRGDTKFLFEC